jgi:8-oxo-dGTP pyrophosphatase MutT (NUDIX family)
MKLGKSQREKEPKRVASVAAYNADGMLLFGRRGDSQKWTLPGGHLNPGEEPMEGARRELLEEAGLTGQDFQFLGRGLGGPKGDIIIYAFRCVVEGEPDASQDPDEEIEDWKWTEPDDMPEEVTTNLHNPNNVTLRLLGLQDGEVEEPMAKADPHFVERNPYSGSAIKIPKYGTRTRKKWDAQYLTDLATSFAGGDVGRLRPIQIPTDQNLGSNMAVNKSRLALYKRMLKAKDRLPPVVVKRVGMGYHLLDGNHRLEAARQHGLGLIHAVEVQDPPLKKGLPGLALVGALAMGGAKPQAEAPKPAIHEMAQQQGMPVWTPDSLHPDLHPIAHLESSWGQNMSHASHSKGDFHTAYGAVGFKPVTAHEEYTKSKFMQKEYPDLMSPENFLNRFKNDSKFYNLLASAHFARLKHRHGGPQQAAFAWRWGTGAAAKATPEQITNDAYVQKYTHMNLHAKQGQPTLKKTIADQLVEKIKPHLTDDLRRAPWKGSANCLAGHCYVASEALWHLLGGQASGYIPQSIQHEGGPHWYLKHKETGQILDPTASQFESSVPYEKGVGKGFLTKQPSKRAQIVIDSVRTRRLQKSAEHHDPLEAMLHHDDPRERVMALRSKLCTPYHLRLALQDEDPDVRAAAAKHPMMTSSLIEEALRHPDLHTKEAALSRPDLLEHHLEQAIWDPDLQTRAALHPALTEDQRQKLVGASDTPEGLRTELLAKSVGYLLYPKLDQARPATEPMIRTPEAHQKFRDAIGSKTGTYGFVQSNNLRDKELAPEKRFLRASVSMKPTSSLGNLKHETQHSVFAALRQKYGREAGHRIVATTLSALDPKDHQHLRNITDWAVQNRYDPIKEPEERIAYLQNYLQDGLWRKSAHKHMRIHMDKNAEKVSHDWAKSIWQKLRNRAEGLGPEHVGVVRKAEDDIKAWVFRKSDPDMDYNVYEDMLGLTPRSEAFLEAAKFMGHTAPDEALFRQCLLADKDLIDAALVSVGIEPTEENRKALQSVMKLQGHGLKKASQTHEITALMPDGTEVAEGVRRGFGSSTEQELHLGGRHSKGAMMVRDPEAGQMYLLKPGSGQQSPAKGAAEERANQSRREAAFWHVAEAWGLNQRVPRADLLLIDGKEVAVLHLLPFDWKNLEKLKFKDAGLPHKALEKYRQMGELHKWAIMDYVLGNPDRHGQNLMVGSAKEGYPVALIDHGSAFAGSHFDPAHDRNSFIPYYLRAWKAEGWQDLTPEQKLRAMPAVSGDTEKQLREWFHGINLADLETLLHRYGIDPAPSAARLAKVKALLAEPNFSEAVNRIWLAT